MRLHPFQLLALLLLPVYGAETQRHTPKTGYREWKVYGGGPESIRYSNLDQINRGNVAEARRSPGLSIPATPSTGSEMQCNPIVVNGVLFATTPKLRVIALDAATGKLRWSFDPNEGAKITHSDTQSRRHVLGRRARSADFLRLPALPLRARRAAPARRHRLRRGWPRRSPRGPGPRSARDFDFSHHPGHHLSGSADHRRPHERGLCPRPPGDIRAYDVRTGKLRWSFHTIPHPGEFGYDTWPKDAWKYSGAANNWSGMSVDEKRGLVFVPTGSAAFDFYGANRIGDDLFANTLIALKADTGERVWHFQAVKHDLWDRDFPAPPNLVTVMRDGKLVDAVAQITKAGVVFVFERETGKPLFPIEYREVPRIEVDGEVTAATQPFPAQAAAVRAPDPDRGHADAPHARGAPGGARVSFEKIRSAGQFVPPSFEGTVVFPGFDGAAEWGGAAFDPATGLLYVNSNEMAWILRLVERPKAEGAHQRPRDLSAPIAPVAITRICAAARRIFRRSWTSAKACPKRRSARWFARGAGACRPSQSLSPRWHAALVHFLLTGEDTRGGSCDASGEPLAVRA